MLLYHAMKTELRFCFQDQRNLNVALLEYFIKNYDLKEKYKKLFSDLLFFSRIIAGLPIDKRYKKILRNDILPLVEKILKDF